MAEHAFHDYLGLAARPLNGCRAMVFCGRSGAGKSSYIEWLLARHPTTFTRDERPVTVFDEITRLPELGAVARAMHHGRVMVASHLSPSWHHLLRFAGPVAVWNLDRPRHKLRRWLEIRRIGYTESALAQFHDRFAANYTDCEIMMERYPGLDFDAAWQCFQRECSVRLTPEKPT